ncbi:MAG TPA: phosphotransferase [Chloroflexota bacterium]|nr:phosphotransferase [Chloroflexota bacterium]
MVPSTNTIRPRRLVDWWTDDPSNPGRASLSHPAVQQLIAEIAADCRVTDLGGTMSLNVRIDPAGLVLRVHQPFVSRHRLLALQAVRRDLDRQGLGVPVPIARRGSTVFRCGDRWAELEPYIPHEKPAPALASYSWLFGAMGRLHRALVALDLTVPRPLVATYAPPGSLRRWLRVTASAVQDDAEARDIVRRTRNLLQPLQTQWVAATRLPTQLVHGDMRLGNVCRSAVGDTVYLDFGFLAFRPRIHDLAYSIAFMLRALNGDSVPARFSWQSVPQLIEEYECTATAPLTALERDALAAYTAAVPLYFSALAGFSNDPVRQLRASAPFLSLSEWLLAYPRAYREALADHGDAYLQL